MNSESLFFWCTEFSSLKNNVKTFVIAVKKKSLGGGMTEAKRNHCSRKICSLRLSLRGHFVSHLQFKSVVVSHIILTNWYRKKYFLFTTWKASFIWEVQSSKGISQRNNHYEFVFDQKSRSTQNAARELFRSEFFKRDQNLNSLMTICMS